MSAAASRVKRAVDRLLAPALERHVDRVLHSVGAAEARRVLASSPASLQAAEFKVFSQWNEDGILQFLASRVPIERRSFVEIGVGGYAESNTRFLASHSNWDGVAIDRSTAHVDFIRDRELDWRFGVRGVTAFVTRDTVNRVIADAGYEGDIGLLSIDVDGQDYWLLKAVDVISPRILVVEYNATFGTEKAVTVPFDADFDMFAAHPSGIYFGASLPALVELAHDRGYEFVGCESHGANAFFVRRDVAAAVPSLSAVEGFAPSQFRMSRDASGELDLMADVAAKLRRIRDMPLVVTTSGEPSTVGAVFGV
jgi:hypothetical protein